MGFNTASLLHKGIDWLGKSNGPKSNVPDADRGNFDVQGAGQRGNFYDNEMQSALHRNNVNSANNSSFRGYQDSLAQRLSNQVNGQDSLSRLQLRDSTDQNLAQQRSLAASATPGNQAMAQRLAGQNAGQINQGFGAQAAQLGIQERNAAANALAGLSQGARQQDLQNNWANQNAAMQQRGLNDQMSLGMGQLANQNAGQQLQGSMGYEQNQTTRRGQDLAVPPTPTNGEKLLGAAAGVIPFLARGGVAMHPTQAIVGEAGPEAILPLKDLPGLVAAQGNDEEAERVKQRAAAVSAAQGSDNPYAQLVGGLMGYHDKHAAAAKQHAQIGGGLAQVANRGEASRDGRGLGELHGIGTSPSHDGSQDSTLGYRLMATGGIVNEPTRAIIGEAGPEAVIPLHRLPDLVARLGGRTKQTAHNTGGPRSIGAGGSVDYRKPQKATDPRDVRKDELAREKPYKVEHDRDVMAELPWEVSARASDAEARAKAAQDEATKRAREAKIYKGDSNRTWLDK